MSSIDVIARGSKNEFLNLGCAFLELCDITVRYTFTQLSVFHSRQRLEVNLWLVYIT